MINDTDTASANAAPATTPARIAGEAFDALGQLAAALAPEWQVEQETDYLGNVSFVTLPKKADPEMPAFILYEKEGQAHVATVRQDTWENDRAFATCDQAVNAVVDRATIQVIVDALV